MDREKARALVMRRAWNAIHQEMLDHPSEASLLAERALADLVPSGFVAKVEAAADRLAALFVPTEPYSVEYRQALFEVERALAWLRCTVRQALWLRYVRNRPPVDAYLEAWDGGQTHKPRTPACAPPPDNGA